VSSVRILGPRGPDSSAAPGAATMLAALAEAMDVVTVADAVVGHGSLA